MANKIFLRVFRLTVGWFLLIVGFIGLFVPVLQGWLFMLAGLSLLAAESEWARKVLTFLKKKFNDLFKRRGAGNSSRNSGD